MPPHSPSSAPGSSTASSRPTARGIKRKKAPASTNLFQFFAPRSGPAPSCPSTTSPLKRSTEDEELELAIKQSLRDHEEHQRRCAGEIAEDTPPETAIDDDDDFMTNRPTPPNMPPCMPVQMPVENDEDFVQDSDTASPLGPKARSARDAFSLLMSNSNTLSGGPTLDSVSTLPLAGSSLSASDADPLLTPSTLIKLWTQCDQIEGRNKLKRGTRKKREVPFYKVLFGMPLSVDAFRFGNIDGCVGYFLSHAHSDHYAGLSPSWSAGPIYCSQTTGNLMVSSLGVPKEYVHPLPYDVEWEVPKSGGVTVTLLPANHCPGSCVFLFKGPRTAYILPKPAPALGIPTPSPLPCIDPATGVEKQWHYLHCGDFRASPALLNHPAMKGLHIDVVYLDTTYLNPRYCFPAQEEVVRECAQCAWDNLGSKEEKLRAERQLREWEEGGWKITEELGWRTIKSAKEERDEAKKRKFQEERRGMSGWLRGEIKVEQGHSEDALKVSSEDLGVEEGDAEEEAAWRDAHTQLSAKGAPGMYDDGDDDEFGDLEEPHAAHAADLFRSTAADDDDLGSDLGALEDIDWNLRSDMVDQSEETEDPTESGPQDPTDREPRQQQESVRIKQEFRTPSPPPVQGLEPLSKSPGVVGSRVLQALDFEHADENDGTDTEQQGPSEIPFWKRMRHSNLEAGSKEYIDLNQVGLVVPAGQSRLSFRAERKNQDETATSSKTESAKNFTDRTIAPARDEVAPTVPRPRGRLLIVVGTYSIGKEKIALSCALRMGTRIFCCSPSKYRIFSQLEDEPLLQSLLTTDPTKAQVHVTNLFSVSYESLRAHLDALKKGWDMDVDRCIAFRPTGWSYRPSPGTTMANIPLAGGKAGGIADGVVTSLVASNLARARYDWKSSFRPTRDSTAKIQVYGVPYSEHSSFFELTCFALSLRSWDRMVPTVNVGNKASRARMDAWIRAWKKEKTKRIREHTGDPSSLGIVGRNAQYF
ncbi:unnamed protein product [Parajaminaea phylloscopi]